MCMEAEYVRTNITLTPEILKGARKHELNISKIARRAVKMEIEKAEREEHAGV